MIIANYYIPVNYQASLIYWQPHFINFAVIRICRNRGMGVESLFY